MRPWVKITIFVTITIIIILLVILLKLRINDDIYLYKKIDDEYIKVTLDKKDIILIKSEVNKIDFNKNVLIYLRMDKKYKLEVKNRKIYFDDFNGIMYYNGHFISVSDNLINVLKKYDK